MRAKQLPELDYLNEIFVLRNDGKLIWQTRPVSHFQTLTSCKSWNTKYVGKEAGSIKQGYRRLRINGDEYLAHRVAYYMFWGDIDDELEIDHIRLYLYNLTEPTYLFSKSYQVYQNANGNPLILGGNQKEEGGDQVSIKAYNKKNLLGIRRAQ